MVYFFRRVDEFLMLRRSVVPLEHVVGVAPDPERIVVADRLGGLDGAGFAAGDEVVLDRGEIAERLACLMKVTKWPPQSELKTASGFLESWALMNGV